MITLTHENVMLCHGVPTGNIQIQEEFDRPAFWAVHLYQTNFTTAEGKEQGRIYGSPVADGWAGAVMRKLIGIQKCDRPTDRPTDRNGKVLSRVPATKNAKVT